MASLIAQAADLVGEDPRCPRPPRPSLQRAARNCSPGQVVAARDAKGQDMAVYTLSDGSAFAVRDCCPHDGGPLSDGFVEAERLVCARHGWEFDGRSGACPRRGVRLCPIPLPSRAGSPRPT